MPKVKAFNRSAAYHWYLSTTFWRERREHALTRANYTCERCKERRATEVHHVTYLRVFNERPTDLMALCRKCHMEIHDKRAANDNQLSFRFL
jgi:5-methylcytosine-specific restriction endonuclease McrA